MSRIITLGEVLIDMVDTHQHGLQDAIHFEKKFGGASANVAIAASRLGADVLFLGSIGDDDFGSFIHKTLSEENVNLELTTTEGTTTIAWVGLNKDGERSFNFSRGSDGDYVLKPIVLDKSDIIHFGSATAFLGGSLETSYYDLLNQAVEAGSTISFDPNYRDTLIKSLPEYKSHAEYFIKRADYVKLSLEELGLLSDSVIGTHDNIKKAVKKIQSNSKTIFFITIGREGTVVISNDSFDIVESIEIVQVDSTGAGDAFTGAILSELYRNDPDKTLLDRVAFANKVGALACTKFGAISALPYLEDLDI